MNLWNADRPGRVVVGVDDSPAGEAAVARGVAEAQQRDSFLHLVRVWREVDLLFSLTRAEVARLPETERANKLLLTRAARQAHELAPELLVTKELLPGDLFEALAGVSARADVLILGRDRPDSDSGIAAWLDEHAACPVIVVEPAPAAG